MFSCTTKLGVNAGLWWETSTTLVSKSSSLRQNDFETRRGHARHQIGIQKVWAERKRSLKYLFVFFWSMLFSFLNLYSCSEFQFWYFEWFNLYHSPHSLRALPFGDWNPGAGSSHIWWKLSWLCPIRCSWEWIRSNLFKVLKQAEVLFSLFVFRDFLKFCGTFWVQLS